MKERPIIAKAHEVLAILDGRQTQMRRVAKLTDSGRVKAVGTARNWHLGDPNAVLACPHGQPGDRLWVRESIECVVKDGEWASSCYSADGQPTVADAWPWKANHLSPMFMPYGLSRITLELVNVRVERVQDILPSDAIAEGILVEKGSGMIEGENCYMMTTNSGYMRGPQGAICAYQDLWNSIHGKNPARCWEANPWTWVLEFKRVKP